MVCDLSRFCIHQGARASRPHCSIPVCGTPTLLEPPSAPLRVASLLRYAPVAHPGLHICLSLWTCAIARVFAPAHVALRAALRQGWFAFLPECLTLRAAYAAYRATARHVFRFQVSSFQFQVSSFRFPLPPFRVPPMLLDSIKNSKKW